MTTFQESVAHYCGNEPVAIGAAACCPECIRAYDISDRDKMGRFRSVDDMQEDLYGMDCSGFSWHQCDSCGSTFGGDRHPAHIVSKKYGVIHLEVCTDCAMYHANGDVPEQWERTP